MDNHFHNHHTNSHLKNSNIKRDVVIGMSDGLIIPFALAAGLSSAFDKSSIIIIVGIAAVAIYSIAMSMGGFLAGKTEQDHYKNKVKTEYDENGNAGMKETEKTRDFFANLNLDTELQEEAMKESVKDKESRTAFMKKYELDEDKKEPKHAFVTALTIGLSYIAGGFIPLSPYFFISDSIKALKVAVVATLICLLIFGYFRSKITGINPVWGAFKIMLIGALAAGAAFAVAKIFEAN